MSELQHERWVLHDQLGSNAACFDENGNQSDENTYDAWGQSFWTQVILDGHPRNVSSFAHDGGSGVTSVTMAANFAIAVDNAVIRVAQPDEASGRLLYFDVLSTSGDNTILVQDDSSTFYDIVNADIRFTVLAFYNTVTGGTWYDVPVYNAGNDTTTFYGEAWHYGPTAVLEEQGATLVPDVSKPVHLTILSITVTAGADNDEIVVRGRADGLAANGDRFFIQVPPRFVNDPLDGSGADAYATPEKGGSLYLYAGYRYEMRRTGSGIQANTGQYYCWNRYYDPLIGRWTSPDPAATPWSNLAAYARDNPQIFKDPTGLYVTAPGKWAADLARDMGVLADELMFQADEWHWVFPWGSKGVKIEVNMDNCNCCLASSTREKFLAYVGEVYRILGRASTAATRIKNDRDRGGRGWDQFNEGGEERFLLRLFDFEPKKGSGYFYRPIPRRRRASALRKCALSGAIRLFRGCAPMIVTSGVARSQTTPAAR